MKNLFLLLLLIAAVSLLGAVRSTGYDVYGPIEVNTLNSHLQKYLIGTVKDRSGTLVPDANVSITGMNLQCYTQTNENGRFYLGNITVSQVNVTVTKAGYFSLTQSKLINPGPNYMILLLDSDGSIPNGIVLSDDLTIYADSITQGPPFVFTLSGNVNVNGVLTLPGNVYVYKGPHFVYPKVIFNQGAYATFGNESHNIISNGIFRVKGKDLIPWDFNSYVDFAHNVGGFSVEVGRISIGQEYTAGKYVTVKCMLKVSGQSFFKAIMDKAHLLDLTQPVESDSNMAALNSVSVSVSFTEHQGTLYGCSIGGISKNFYTFKIKNLTMAYDPVEDKFSGTLHIKIPGTDDIRQGEIIAPHNTPFSPRDLTLPVVLTDTDTGHSLQTNLGELIELNDRGIFSFFEVKASLELLGGELNALSISLSGINIPIFVPGAFIRQINGGVSGLRNNNLTISASIDIGPASYLEFPGLGPCVYLDDVGVVIKPWYYFKGSGACQVFKHEVASASVEYNSQRQTLDFIGMMQILLDENDPGSDIVKGRIYAGIAPGNFNAGLNARIKTPDNLPWWLNWAEGIILASADASISNYELRAMIQVWFLSAAMKCVFGNPNFPWFHFYVGANYSWMIQLWKGSRDGRQAIDFLVPENAGQIVVVAGNDTNLFDFEVSDPLGTEYGSLDPGYRQFPATNQTVLVIDNPRSGTWEFSTDQTGDITTEFLVLNQAPTALVSMPSRRGSRDNTISLDLSDYSDTLNVKVFYDTDDRHFDGVPIQEFTVLNNAELSFVWHNTDLPNGEYYIYTRVDDGYNPPVLQYAPGSILVNNYYVEAPQNVQAFVAGDSIYVAWDPPVGEGIVLTEIQVRDLYNPHQYYSYGVTGVDSLTIGDVPGGLEYEILCRFGNTQLQMSEFVSGGILFYPSGRRNEAPYFTLDPEEVWVFVEEQPRSYALSALDPEGDGLSYFIDGGEAGMSAAGGTFSWTPSPSQKGYFQIPLVVSDGAGSDTLLQQMAVYSLEQAQLRVRFSSFNLYEADRMFLKLNNLYSEDYYQYVTLTNLRTNQQAVVECRRVNDLEYIGMFSLSVRSRTVLAVQDGDQIQASYSYGGNTFTALSIYSSTPQPADVTPPAPVTDLQATFQPDGTLKLSWTASGDNGDTGTAYSYDLRYKYSPMQDLDDYLNANLYTVNFYPSPAGSLDSLSIDLSELPYAAHYDSLFFALVVEDARQNRSGLSNCASAAYLAAPATVTASLVNAANASLYWTDVSRTGGATLAAASDSKTREAVDFLGYRLLRELDSNTEVIAENLQESNYLDNIASLADGTLRYGVQAVYGAGSSAASYSGSLALDRLVDLRIYCQRDSLAPAAGANYSIAGQDSLFQQSFSGQTNLSGVILLDGVYQSTYGVELDLAGCFPASYVLEVSGQQHEFVLDIFSVAIPQPLYLQIQGGSVQLGWYPVARADYYLVYAADDPYASDWGEPLCVVPASEIYNSTTVPLIGGRRFFRVVTGVYDE